MSIIPVVPTILPKKQSAADKGFPQSEIPSLAPAFNPTFMKSNAGRTARIICELEEYPRRMANLGVRGTFLVFGSARSRYGWQLDKGIADLNALIADAEKNLAFVMTSNSNAKDEKKVAELSATIKTAKAKKLSVEGLRWAAEWMVKTEELCRLLTEWAISPRGRHVGMMCKSNLLPNEFSNAVAARGPSRWYKGYQSTITAAAAGDVHADRQVVATNPNTKPRSVVLDTVKRGTEQKINGDANVTYAFEQPLVVCSGGGPGFMEAANKGAYEAGGVSMGVAITLPFETQMNDYVTPGLHFQTEYFFTRKFWEVFSAKCMICTPGGMGTCDEMFEVLTLLQCNHCQDLPIVLLGKSFWTECINFKRMSEYNMISAKEVSDLCITDSVEEAFNHIVNFLEREAAQEEMRLKKRQTSAKL